MDNELFQAYLTQLSFECDCVERAANAVADALQPRAGTWPPLDVVGVFCGLQNMLAATANLSKLLWGQKGEAVVEAERQPLRERLRVADESALRELRMRNHYEHFDERIDRWWADPKRQAFIDLNITSGRAIILDADPINMFRNYDPQTGMLTFWGQTFELAPILQEVRRLKQTIESIKAFRTANQGVPSPAE